MKKRSVLFIACILMIAILSLMFTGCSDSNTADESATNETNEGKNNTTNESDTNSSENTEELTEDDIVFPLSEPVTFTMLTEIIRLIPIGRLDPGRN